MTARLSHKTRRGSTILETVIAFFIIAGGMALIAGLYASTMGGQADDVRATTIVLLAESRMAELRSLGSETLGYQGLSTEAGVVNPPAHAGYQVQTLVADLPRPYPCTGIQSVTYANSYKRVVVRVTAPGGEELKLVSVIAEPLRTAGQVVVTRISGSDPLPRDEEAEFEARLDADDGTEIQDVQFRFYVDFGRGNGRIVEDADGRTVHFFNHILNLTGANIYTGGEIRIVARTFYAGQEYRGVSSDLNLAP